MSQAATEGEAARGTKRRRTPTISGPKDTDVILSPRTTARASRESLLIAKDLRPQHDRREPDMSDDGVARLPVPRSVKGQSRLKVRSAHDTMLLGIPVELRAKVIDYVPNCDLPALRLVSRKMAEATWDAYISAFFEIRECLFTTQGLQNLRDISVYPPLAKNIRKLIFKLCNLEKAAFTADPARLDAWKAWDVDRVKRRTWRPDMVCTIQIFEALASHCPCVDIEIQPWVKTMAEPYDMMQLESWLDIPLKASDFGSHGCAESVADILMAISHSAMVMQSLQLTDTDPLEQYDIHMYARALEVDLSRFCLPRRPFCKLIYLKINLGLGLGFIDSPWPAALSTVFSSATSLRYLKLSGNGGGEDVEGPKALLIVQSLPTSRLHTIILEQICALGQIFIDILNVARSTLKNVEIQYCFIGDTDYWVSVLDWVVHYLQLDSLSLIDLEEWGGPLLVLGSNSDRECALEGRASIKDCLRSIIEDPEYIDLISDSEYTSDVSENEAEHEDANGYEDMDSIEAGSDLEDVEEVEESGGEEDADEIEDGI